ncbi:MAG: cobaltochelatase subunit CobN [Geminocystis sp.]|nr:cobaltochelatase subunit CobN [Geminocystis sp.]MCS7148021.1 cobaltochelatase subunit CobN [Geminocystis sp.]MCX8077764.1 cobaltochelatase subunit CobN [Geminocystis sp.]MDW8116373.1 cobaltochelatase subunit CobN [Geminocystis sp.]MDW8462142.1 cobaltochelatase subunit CobN [Geminocystis sp.]
MHKLAAIPGGWNPDIEGVIFVSQTPADIIFITSADTDIQTTAACLEKLPPDFPSIRVVNLLQLQQELSIDTYAEEVLYNARVIIVRLLGGRSYWSYGLETCRRVANDTNASLFILPGDNRPQPELFASSNVSLPLVTQLWRYFTEGGVENFANAFKFVANTCLGTQFTCQPPKVIPRFGLYFSSKTAKIDVAILFYRSHFLAGNTRPIDSLIQALNNQNISVIAIYLLSLKEPDIQLEIGEIISNKKVDLILNTTSFSLARIGDETSIELWQKLDVPVLQVIFSGSTQEYWEKSFQGLSPKDVAMNVALPEVDGRIITRAISFKSAVSFHPRLETDVVVYQPLENRINYLVELTKNWLKIRRKKNSEKRIALILANYPNKDGRIANGVGLDTPASCIQILKALQENDYLVENIPENGDELVFRIIKGVTNEREILYRKQINQSISLEEYQQYFTSLPDKVQREIISQWGGINQIPRHGEMSDKIPIPGIQLGNIFIGIQPSRGYDVDPSLSYHSPDLPPTHHYLAFYYWIKNVFCADAIIHVGKHGNLEWLPGKSIALSENCYPEIAIGSIPHFYPFIVNDPGEGTQAKRRSNAVIIDHLTPPLTQAELYGDLLELEFLIDEYYQAQSLNPSRIPVISEKIYSLVAKTKLNEDLGVEEVKKDSLAEFLTLADGYLCELKEAQIRNGLHVLGVAPEGRQLRDLTLAIARFNSYQKMGIIEAIKEDLLAKGGDLSDIERGNTERLETMAQQLVESVIKGEKPGNICLGKNTEKCLNWIADNLLPKLRKTREEIDNLIRGLEGKYIPSGGSGAPTRGRSDVLPTGRNFYAVDIRTIPTETAWEVGRKAAETLIETYTQEYGEYPRSLAISVWGTSTMRTGGDDIAQIMALMGVKPVWDGNNRRVVNYEIIPLSLLKRPRVDVTVRVSGFFRDSFPNILELLYEINLHVASLKEEGEYNPLAMRVEEDTKYWLSQGLNEEEARRLASYRIFGSKPGAYGAGLQGLIDSQNWQTDEDLAKAYLNWSSYAYEGSKGVFQPEVFARRLTELQIVLHNQDNREHDILDSDNYYQFQGGLVAAVRHLKGGNPIIYFGDNSQPDKPKVRHLREEIARVYRSRVVNPKWIRAMMHHGYRGAFEMSATVDFLFAYAATTKVVPDFLFTGVAEAYLLDDSVRNFLLEKNPWALRDMAERLMEASQRNLWKADGFLLDKLREIVHESEGVLENFSP